MTHAIFFKILEYPLRIFFYIANFYCNVTFYKRYVILHCSQSLDKCLLISDKKHLDHRKNPLLKKLLYRIRKNVFRKFQNKFCFFTWPFVLYFRIYICFKDKNYFFMDKLAHLWILFVTLQGHFYSKVRISIFNLNNSKKTLLITAYLNYGYGPLLIYWP